nr:inhibin alpha chain [Nothobranchius furzeri]
MVSCGMPILVLLWIQSLVQAYKPEELPRGVILSWFKERVLENLGLEKPPLTRVRGPGEDTTPPNVEQRHRRVLRTTRAVRENHEPSRDRETSQVILFPSDSSFALVDSAMNKSTRSYFTFYFQPSKNLQAAVVTSAHFCFFEGGAGSSASLFIFSAQQLYQAAQTPTLRSSDGWSTFSLDGPLMNSIAEGPFLLQVRCLACQWNRDPEQMAFLHLHVKPRGRTRSPRDAVVTIPWSPTALHLLQRPSQEEPQHDDCRREEIEISFEELGWDSWIVQPKVLTFYYCHGNCSAWDRTSARLGMTQCCAPVPGSMKSLKITTTSDGGYSFKYETLPNIMPKECTCV